MNEAKIQGPSVTINTDEKSIDHSSASLSQWIWMACLALTICGVSVTYWLSSDDIILEVRFISIIMYLEVMCRSLKMQYSK